MISFITSLYKSEEHLAKYVSRVKKFSKTLEDLGVAHEFIILPNDPSQKEQSILNELSTSKPALFKIHTRVREPLYATWSHGARVAEGDVLCSWNVDDIRFASVIPEIISLIDPSQAQIIYPSFTYVRGITLTLFKTHIKIPLKIKKITPPPFEKNRFMREMHMGPFFFFTKKAFEMIGPFDDTFRIAGDFEWQARAASKDIAFKRYTKAVGMFTNYGTSLSGSRNPLQTGENQRIYDIYKL